MKFFLSVTVILMLLTTLTACGVLIPRSTAQQVDPVGPIVLENLEQSAEQDTDVSEDSATSEEVYCGMSLEDHGKLLETLYQQEHNEQIQSLRAAASEHQFTSEQALAILYTIGYDTTREEVAILMYPHICDPDNWYMIYSAIESSAIRDDLREVFTKEH